MCRGRTPLYVAAKNGHLDVVQFRLEHGADVNTRDNSGRTPLHVAEENRHFFVAKFLREKTKPADVLGGVTTSKLSHGNQVITR